MSGLDIRDLAQHAAANAAEFADVAVAREDLVSKQSSLAESRLGSGLKGSYSPVVLAGAVRLFEFLMITTLGFVIHQFYVVPEVGFDSSYIILVLAIAAGSLLLFQAMDLYDLSSFRSVLGQGLRLSVSWAMVFLMTLAALFFAKAGDSFSRVWFAGWFTVGLAALLVERMIISITVRALTHRGRLERRTAIVGGGETAEALIRALDMQPDTGIRICGVFDDRGDERASDLVAGYPKLGRVDDLIDYARNSRLDLVIFTLPISAENRLLHMLSKLWILPIDIRLSAHSSKLRLRPQAYSYIGNVPFLDVFDKPIADWDLIIKWLFDKVVATLALITLSPVFALTALAIKFDSSGPVFFRQKRYGFNNELIEVWKFRSMYIDQCDATASQLVTKNDKRVTRVGSFIRKTSIDELPQLLNVLFGGSLSLVGPRPHAVHAKAENRLYDQVVDGYFARHKVKPGITGWAQIHGWRGETDTQEKIQRRVEHDLYYIENWSVFLDIYILLATPFALMKTDNAY